MAPGRGFLSVVLAFVVLVSVGGLLIWVTRIGAPTSPDDPWDLRAVLALVNLASAWMVWRGNSVGAWGIAGTYMVSVVTLPAWGPAELFGAAIVPALLFVALARVNRLRAADDDAERGPSEEGWECRCGVFNTPESERCECGRSRPSWMYPSVDARPEAPTWACACGTDNRAAARFCKSCGEGRRDKKRKCRSCKQVNEPDARFCDGCGLVLKPN